MTKGSKSFGTKNAKWIDKRRNNCKAASERNRPLRVHSVLNVNPLPRQLLLGRGNDNTFLLRVNEHKDLLSPVALCICSIGSSVRAFFVGTIDTQILLKLITRTTAWTSAIWTATIVTNAEMDPKIKYVSFSGCARISKNNWQSMYRKCELSEKC